MSEAAWVAAIVIVVMIGGTGVYIVGTSTHMTITTTATVTTTASTIITSTTTTLCATTVTGNLGNFRGAFPNGTQWISIDGHYYRGNTITNGTLPYSNQQNAQNWWIINSC